MTSTQHARSIHGFTSAVQHASSTAAAAAEATLFYLTTQRYEVASCFVKLEFYAAETDILARILVRM